MSFSGVLVCLCGCADDVAHGSPKLAIEAWIDSDGYPVVVLTRSLSPSSSPQSVSDAMIRWGKVTISDGVSTEMMTGGMDYDMLPPFSYKCFKMQGVVGRTYTIVAEYEGMRACASATILPPASIDFVRFDAVNDSLRSASLGFTAPEDADTCHFVVFTRVRNREDRHYPAFLGGVVTTRRGQSDTVAVHRGKHADMSGDFQSDFVRGDTLDIILARVSSDVYAFWDAYQNTVYFANNIFLSSGLSSLPGNISGAYGIFSARGIARRTLRVE